MNVRNLVDRNPFNQPRHPPSLINFGWKVFSDIFVTAKNRVAGTQSN